MVWLPLKHYAETEMECRPNVNGVLVPICPACKGHKQEGVEYCDCKNTYTTIEGITGQCCCYSKEHGERFTRGDRA